MFKHVKGCVHIDDQHIIIYGGRRTPSLEILRGLCHKAFPKLVGPDDWIWKGEIPTDSKSHQKVIPVLFNRMVTEEDEQNDWEGFPYVAIELQKGVVKSTPLSAT